MKNKLRFIIPPILLILAGLAFSFFVFWRNAPEKFALEPELYEGSTLQELTADEFSELLSAEKSFVVIAHMDFCPAETPLTTTAEALAHEDGFTFYGLSSDEFAKTALADKVTYLPSAAIYHAGELVRFLDAESDADLPYYQSPEKFREWLGEYIELKRV